MTFREFCPCKRLRLTLPQIIIISWQNAKINYVKTLISLRAGHRQLKYKRKLTVFLACKIKEQSSRQSLPIENEREMLERTEPKRSILILYTNSVQPFLSNLTIPKDKSQEYLKKHKNTSPQ
jgi:hypothetical protein